MTRTSADELLSAGESAELEFKATLSDSRRIIETIAAMATSGGGTMLVGVRDDGRVVGLDLGEGEVERLIQQVLAHTDPKVFVDVDEAVAGGRRVLRIRVPPGDGPHLAFGRAYYRPGRATVAMTRDEYERRLLGRLRESSGFERRTEPGLSIRDVDPGAVREFLDLAKARMPGVTSDIPPAELLERLHLGGDDRLTIGGMLLFGRDPDRPFPQSMVRARALRGAHEDAQAIPGPLPRQIDDAVAFVTRNLRVRPVREGVRRTDVPELPLAAVREVVANAIAHRDYRSTAPTQILLDDSGLEVWNPGHLPPPITPESLRRRHPSVPTNPLIARALYVAGYIEEWGTGTLRVIDAMRTAGHPEPLFEAERDGGIRAVLPLTAGRLPHLPPRLLKALGRLDPERLFRSAEYADTLGVSLRTANLDLARLESAGLVQQSGTGRSTRWQRVVSRGQEESNSDPQ
jgi:ATP-dependent DNA helicase RecG